MLPLGSQRARSLLLATGPPHHLQMEPTWGLTCWLEPGDALSYVGGPIHASLPPGSPCAVPLPRAPVSSYFATSPSLLLSSA